MKALGFTLDRVHEMIREFLRTVLKRRATKEREGYPTSTTPPQPPSEVEKGDTRP
jgi:hypothetical protein